VPVSITVRPLPTLGFALLALPSAAGRKQATDSDRLADREPDFNQIERCWSEIKTFLRKAKARTIGTPIEAIKQALATISKSDALAWFARCGYTVH
jgi:hypothetical protein